MNSTALTPVALAEVTAVTTLAEAPALLIVAVTVAPATGLPDESVTRPVTSSPASSGIML